MRKTILLLLAISGCTATPAAAAPTFPDRGGAGVVDAAGVIPAAAERALNEKVVAWNKATQHQLAVATVPSLQGYDVKEYGYQLLRSWGLGRKGVNDGIILLLAPSERKVRIEVGYGLEPTLTDALTSEIIRTAIVPGLKAGDNVAALNAGVDQIMANAKTEEPAISPVDGKPRTGWIWLASLLGSGAGAWAVIAWSKRKTRDREEAAAERRRAGRRATPVSPPVRFAAAPSETPPRPVRHVPPTPPFTGSSSPAPRRRDPIEHMTPVVAPVPVYSPPPPPPSPSYSSDWSSSSSSSDSSSSSSSFDSGGGSCGGGGSDSSY